MTGSEGLSALMRTEFTNIAAGFTLLPTIAGNAGKTVVVNGGGTALTVSDGALALAGNFTTTGPFNTILAQTSTVTLTLPSVDSTLATVANISTETGRALAAEALLAPRISPTFTGTPAAPTAIGGTNTTQLATTAFVSNAVAAATTGVSSVAGKTGAVTLVPADVVGAAPLASPTFTGTPLAPTAAPGTNTTQLATTAFDTAAILVETNRASAAEALLAPKASPTFTGTVNGATATFTGTVSGAAITATSGLITPASGQGIVGQQTTVATGSVGELKTGANGGGSVGSSATPQTLIDLTLGRGNWLVFSSGVVFGPDSGGQLTNSFLAISKTAASISGSSSGLQVTSSVNGDYSLNPGPLYVADNGTNQHVYLNEILVTVSGTAGAVSASTLYALRVS